VSDGATQQLAEFDESHNPLEWNRNVIVTGDALSGKTDFFRNLEASASSEYIDLLRKATVRELSSSHILDLPLRRHHASNLGFFVSLS
jgi:hypothetical protein